MSSVAYGLLMAAALIGSHLGGNAVDKDEWRAGPDVDRMLNDFARCMVRGQPKQAHALLMMSPTAPESADRLISWVAQRSGCLRVRGNLRMRPPVMRGAIAERLYLETFARPPGLGQLPTGVQPSSEDFRLVPYEVVQCAAGRDPVAADRLVRSRRRSPEEVEAVNRLKPALNACARPGVRLELNRTMIRSLTAEGLYKLRSANPAMEETA
ncbi:MAG TPA: hypothetical protein VFZ91_10060 [Allosphingosinicella sp.]